MKFAFFNTDGFVETAINDDTLKELPSDAIELTDKQWDGRFNLKLVDGKLVKVSSLPEIKPTIEELREKTEVTAFQAQAALARAGKYDEILAIMDSQETPLEMKLAWNKAQSFKRLSPTVLAMAQLLKLSEAQLDDLFTLAKTIEA